MRAFFAGLWAKIKLVCMGSITMAWSYFLGACGEFLQNVEAIAAVLGDPSLKDQITAAIGDTKTVGRIVLGIGVITAIARLKSLVMPKKAQ
jgi:hypothetical protein